MSPHVIGVDMAAPGSERTVMCYRGKNVDFMTREELLAAVKDLGGLLNQQLDYNLKERRRLAYDLLKQRFAP